MPGGQRQGSVDREKQGAACRGLESLAIKAERVRLKPPVQEAESRRPQVNGHAAEEGREPAESSKGDRTRAASNSVPMEEYSGRKGGQLGHSEHQIRDRVPWQSAPGDCALGLTKT